MPSPPMPHSAAVVVPVRPHPIAATVGPSPLIDLPADLLALVARMLFRETESHHRSSRRTVLATRTLLWLSLACRAVHGRLGPLRDEVRRLTWRSSHPTLQRDGPRVVQHGLTLFGLTFSTDTWSCGDTLPTVGRSAFRVRVDLSGIDERWRGREECLLYIGVCDAAGRCAWGLRPSDGRLRRWSRLPNGRVGGAPTPPGYPNGHLLQVVRDEQGHAMGLEGAVHQAVVEVVVDAEQGALYFGWNGRAPRLALGGFPVGAAMRPWARMVCPGRLVIGPSFEF
jgi:hypothetical protein